MGKHFIIGITIFVVALGIFSITLPDAFAHKSGCHRWHSCPSDTGSYVCGDTGYCSQCPDNNYCKAGKPILSYSTSLSTSSGTSSKSSSSVPSSSTQSSTTTCISLNRLPDSKCTPGAIDPRVTQSNIKNTICKSGYTTTIRPPTSYTEPLKIKLMASYGLKGSTANYELDHLIPLELGGNPTDVKNLWPESWNGNNGAKVKDGFENYLHTQVCSGNIDLKTAQDLIATNWYNYWMRVKN